MEQRCALRIMARMTKTSSSVNSVRPRWVRGVWVLRGKEFLGRQGLLILVKKIWQDKFKGQDLVNIRLPNLLIKGWWWLLSRLKSSFILEEFTGTRQQELHQYCSSDTCTHKSAGIVSPSAFITVVARTVVSTMAFFPATSVAIV